MTVTELDRWGDIGEAQEAANAYAAFMAARGMAEKSRHAEALAATVLVVPTAASAQWQVPSLAESDGLTIVDVRRGQLRVHTPPSRDPIAKSEGSPGTALSAVRDVREDDGYGGSAPTVAVGSRILHGGSSISCLLVRPVEATGARAGRWYPTAMEGIFPGQRLNLPPTAGPPSPVTVDRLGWDEAIALPFFTVKETVAGDRAAETRLQRKTALGAIEVLAEDHSHNQSITLGVEKFAYADGDAFGIQSRLFYQGDFGSSAGDEGGGGTTTDLIQDTRVFTATVETFTRMKVADEPPGTHGGILTFSGAMNVERLGAGRPIINMSAQWTSTTAWLWNGQQPRFAAVHGVVEVPSGGLPPAVVGRFLSIDAPSERLEGIGNGKWAPPSPPLRRWAQITRLVAGPDAGSQLLFVRTKSQDAYDGCPWVTDPHLYGRGPGVKIDIAPGAIPYDVSGGVPEWKAVAGASTLLVQPNGDMAGPHPELPFNGGDAIEQALGGQSSNPTGFRARHFTAFPTTKGFEGDAAVYAEEATDCSFLGVNYGGARVGAGLHLHDGVDGRRARAAGSYRGGTAYLFGLVVGATTRTAIAVTGDVAFSKTQTVRGLPAPDAGVGLLFKQQGGSPEEQAAARKVIAWTEASDPSAQVTVGYDPSSSSFRVAGARHIRFVGADDVDLGGAAIVGQRGLSAMRGTAQVDAGASPEGPSAGVAATAAVTLDAAPAEAATILVTPHWPTGFGVTRTPKGFVVDFTHAPAPGATFEWAILP